MKKLCDKSSTKLRDLLISREITVVDLTEGTLNRTQDAEEQPGSFITVSEEEAMALIKAIDLKGITESNPLAGIPIGIKDNIVTEDVLTTAGSKMLYNFDPVCDTIVMDKAYQADMIPVGELNMDRFATGGSTETSHFKKTKNTRDQTRVPDGSSGGSASVVAAGQVPVSLGSDIGGSIRRPAVFNGIVGLKPTYGRVSHFGLIAFASSLDQTGPLTQNVKDNALVLSAVSGYGEKDGTSASASVPDFTADLTGDIKGMKTALPKEYLGEGVQPDVRGTVLKAAETFRALDATAKEISSPHSKYGIVAYYVIVSSEVNSNLQRFDGIHYGYRSENVQNLEDVCINLCSEGSGTEVKHRTMLGTFSLGAGYYDAYSKKISQVRTLIEQDFGNVSTDYDLITGSSAPTVTLGLGKSINDPITMYMYDILTAPVSLAGLPGMLIPTGFSGGLPASLQIIGKYFNEHTTHETAYASE